MAEEKKETIFTPKRTVKYFFIDLIIWMVAAMIIWPLIDIIFESIFDGGYKGWDVRRGIIEPGVFAVIIVAIEFLFWNSFHKKKK
ncbi:hypothetical protein IJH97_01605 [Candidatus Saccharibacteria bacterium]|nr:hypothetical protein [Candidatus Saccharibacteria bacterium]